MNIVDWDFFNPKIDTFKPIQLEFFWELCKSTNFAVF